MFALTVTEFVLSNSGNFNAKANPPKPRSCQIPVLTGLRSHYYYLIVIFFYIIIRNALKLTYSNVEIQTISGGRTRGTPPALR